MHMTYEHERACLAKAMTYWTIAVGLMCNSFLVFGSQPCHRSAAFRLAELVPPCPTCRTCTANWNPEDTTSCWCDTWIWQLYSQISRWDNLTFLHKSLQRMLRLAVKARYL